MEIAKIQNKHEEDYQIIWAFLNIGPLWPLILQNYGITTK